MLLLRLFFLVDLSLSLLGGSRSSLVPLLGLDFAGGSGAPLLGLACGVSVLFFLDGDAEGEVSLRLREGDLSPSLVCFTSGSTLDGPGFGDCGFSSSFRTNFFLATGVVALDLGRSSFSESLSVSSSDSEEDSELELDSLRDSPKFSF